MQRVRTIMNRILVSLIVLSVASTAAAQCTNATLGCQAVAATLSSDDCSAFDGSRFDIWQFSGTAGQAVTIQMSSTSFDTLLMLIDPSYTPVATNDDATSSSKDSRLTFTLGSTGTWTIVANSLPVSGSGTYVLSMSCPTPGVRRRAIGK